MEINMDVNNLSVGMSGTVAVSKGSPSYSKSGKKSLSYNPRDISSQIMRAKKMTGATQVLSRARAKVAMLRRAKATGKYGSMISTAIHSNKRLFLKPTRPFFRMYDNEKPQETGVSSRFSRLLRSLL